MVISPDMKLVRVILLTAVWAIWAFELVSDSLIAMLLVLKIIGTN